MKALVITVSVILVVALGGGGYLLWQQTDRLEKARSEIVTLEENVAGLETDVAGLEGDVASLETNVDELETKLSDSEAEVSTLETNLTDAESQISSLKSNYAAETSKVSNLRSQLSSAEGKYDSLKQKVDAIEPYTTIYDDYIWTDNAWQTSDIIVIGGLIKNTGNEALEEAWNIYVNNPTSENFVTFLQILWDGLYEVLYGGASI